MSPKGVGNKSSRNSLSDLLGRTGSPRRVPPPRLRPKYLCAVRVETRCCRNSFEYGALPARRSESRARLRSRAAFWRAVKVKLADVLLAAAFPRRDVFRADIVHLCATVTCFCLAGFGELLAT